MAAICLVFASSLSHSLAMRMARLLVALALLTFAAQARSQAIIEGRILGVDRILAENLGARVHPLLGAEIQLQPHDQLTPPVSVRTDARGRFFIGTLAPGRYIIKIFVSGNLEFAADNLGARKGDPLRIEYNMRTAVVTMRNATCKKARCFAWQKPVTGSQLDGHWVETYAPDGYQAPFARVDRKNGWALTQAFAH